MADMLGGFELVQDGDSFRINGPGFPCLVPVDVFGNEIPVMLFPKTKRDGDLAVWILNFAYKQGLTVAEHRMGQETLFGGPDA